MAQTKTITVTQRLLSRMNAKVICQRPDCGRKFKEGDMVVRSSGNLYYCQEHYYTQKGIDEYV